MTNLVPLSLATRHVYLAVQGYAPNARPHERFDRLGRLMASLGGLYVVEGADGAPRKLSREEFDERRAVADVRVSHDCIEKAIDALSSR